MLLRIQEEPKPTYLGDYDSGMFGLGQTPFGPTFKLVDAVGNVIPAQVLKLFDETEGGKEIMSRTSGNNGLVHSVPLIEGHNYKAVVFPLNPNMPVDPPSVTFVGDPKGPLLYQFVLGLKQPGVQPPPTGPLTPAGKPMPQGGMNWFVGLLIAGGAAAGLWWWMGQPGFRAIARRGRRR